MISTKEYLEHVEDYLKNYITTTEEYPLSTNDLEVIQVWYCKTIQNHKGLFIVKNIYEGFIYNYFFECTYNGNAEELYVDVYTKQEKMIFKLEYEI